MSFSSSLKHYKQYFSGKTSIFQQTQPSNLVSHANPNCVEYTGGSNSYLSMTSPQMMMSGQMPFPGLTVQLPPLIGSMPIMSSQSYSAIIATSPSYSYLPTHNNTSASSHVSDNQVSINHCGVPYVESTIGNKQKKSTTSEVIGNLAETPLSTKMQMPPCSHSSTNYNLDLCVNTKNIAVSGSREQSYLPTNVSGYTSKEDDLMYFASNVEPSHDYLSLELFDPLYTQRHISSPSNSSSKLSSDLCCSNTPTESERSGEYAEIDEQEISRDDNNDDSILQDPFSVTNLTQALATLEEKRRKHAVEQEQVTTVENSDHSIATLPSPPNELKMREKPVRPPPLSRRVSYMAKEQVINY